MYQVKDGNICWKGKSLAPADALLVDAHQDVAQLPGVVKMMLPVGDYVLVTKGNRVVGMEEKSSSDLATSRSSRRLQRQLRDLRAAVDIPVLGLRMTNGMIRDTYSVTEWVCASQHLSLELVKWGVYGGVTLLPSEPEAVVRVLEGMRGLTPGRNLATILAGDDRHAVYETGGFEEAMQNLIRGMGPKRARQLSKHFKGSFTRAIGSGVGEWADAGMPTNVIQEFAKLRLLGVKFE